MHFLKTSLNPLAFLSGQRSHFVVFDISTLCKDLKMAREQTSHK
jgi:hypothetical protein